jgi:hypothetical protein
LASSVENKSDSENDDEEDNDASNDDNNFAGDREASSTLIGKEDSMGGCRGIQKSDVGQTIINHFGTVQFCGPLEVEGSEMASFSGKQGRRRTARKGHVVGRNGNGVIDGNINIVLDNDVVDFHNTHVFVVARVIGGISVSAFAVIREGLGGEDTGHLIVETGGICGTILNGVEGIGHGSGGVKMGVFGFVVERGRGGGLPNSFGFSGFDEIARCFPVIIGKCKRIDKGEEEDNKGEGGLDGHSLLVET